LHLGFLSGFVIAPFAFFPFEGAALDAIVVKIGMITYAIMFSFIALVGRLILVIRKSSSTTSAMEKSNAHLMSNKSESNTSKLATDGKVSMFLFRSFSLILSERNCAQPG
jgi:hypothetical protein